MHTVSPRPQIARATTLLLALALISTGCTRRQEIQARLADADGLHAGDQVRVAGVEVGRVSAIGVEGDQAALTLSLDHDLALHAEACVTVEGTPSDRTLRLDPGTSGELHGAIPPCQSNGLLRMMLDATDALGMTVGMVFDTARQAQQAGAEPGSPSTLDSEALGQQAGRELGMAARGAAAGVVEGITGRSADMGGVRQLGAELGMGAREMLEGLGEGLDTPSASPAPTSPAPTSPAPTSPAPTSPTDNGANTNP